MELTWIGIAFVLGAISRWFKQPPLLGFLAAGFALELLGFRKDAALQNLVDVGLKLLLFTIGLKLDLKTVLRPQVWASTLVQMTISTTFFTSIALALSAANVGSFAELDLKRAATIGFVASFASTVFVMKALEEREELSAFYGVIAVSILVMEDLAAVIFLAVSSGKVPSIWALGLVLLFPLRPLLLRFFSWLGHGELLLLGGVTAALVGAGLFEAVQLKGDLGALTFGVLLGGSKKGNELAKSMLGLKDFLLIGFFLSVGLSGLPTIETTVIAFCLLLILPLKSALFFLLLTRLKLRARTSLLVSGVLLNYSEFGLIVGALAAGQGWLEDKWVVTFAQALALSFMLSAPLNRKVLDIYNHFRRRLQRFETQDRLPEEAPVDVGDAPALVFGMGQIGTGAYDTLRTLFGPLVVGFDISAPVVERQVEAERRVIRTSATDADFWQRLHIDPARVQIVVLALSNFYENKTALTLLRSEGYRGIVAVMARYEDQQQELLESGATVVYHTLAGAGHGLASAALEAAGLAPPPLSRGLPTASAL